MQNRLLMAVLNSNSVQKLRLGYKRSTSLDAQIHLEDTLLPQSLSPSHA